MATKITPKHKVFISYFHEKDDPRVQEPALSKRWKRKFVDKSVEVRDDIR